MKKLYRKSTVHPSPPPPSQPPPATDPLAFLPAVVFTLAAALTPQDREVLAYLLSCSFVSPTTESPKQGLNKKDIKSAAAAAHTPASNCDCFSCYTSYWARWDSSPNRQLIHEIIDAYEEWCPAKNRGASSKNRGGRRERKKKAVDGGDSPGVDRLSDVGFAQAELGMPEPAEHGGEPGGSASSEEEEEMVDKGSVKKLVNFIGDRIWGFWG